LESKKSAQPKDQTAAKKENPRVIAEVPAGTTVVSLARAMWAVQSSSKGKIPAEKRGEAWKKDRKEYKQLARKVIANLGRRAGKTKAPGKKAEAAGKKAEAAG
jgi:hypothetical protein